MVVKKITQLYRWNSGGIAEVDYIDDCKPTSFWCFLNDKAKDEINELILKYCNDVNYHIVKHCSCDECKELRKTMKK